MLGAALLWPIFKKRLSFARLYRYSLLGYLLSGLLDACTSYGTHLLWPFSDARVAWHLISVIDPLFTGALLLGLAAERLRAGGARPGGALSRVRVFTTRACAGNRPGTCAIARARSDGGC